MKLNKNELQSFEQLPQGWAVAPLGEVLPILYGKGLTKAKRDETGNCPVYGSSGQVGVHSESLTKRPSLIIGRKGSVGEVYYSKIPCWPIDTVYFVEEREELVLKFFEYLLKGLKLSRLDKSTAIPGLSRDDYNAVEVAVAPLEQQKRIVAEIEKQFSRLDEAVANLKRVKANLKRYKAAVLKAAVEGKLTEEWRKQHPDVEPASKLLERILAERRQKWEETELARMKAKGKVLKDDNWKKKYKEPEFVSVNDEIDLPESWGWVTNDTISFVTKLAGFEYTKFVKYDGAGNLAVLKAENAGKDGFKRTEFSKVKSETVSQLIRSQLIPGDLLMVFVGAGTGNVARVPDDQPYFLGPNIGMIRVESQFVLPEYLELFFRSPLGNSLALGFAKAVAQPSLSMGSIRKIPIVVPPLNEQKIIVAELERLLSNIDETGLVAEANLKRAERLQQSILGQAFSGELSL